jgi:hypothetical protein
MSPQSAGRDRQRGHATRGLIARIAISAVALALAIVHVAAPGVEIDTATVILLGIVALPWLAPYLESISFGGFGVVLRDVHDRVKQVEATVGESRAAVEQLATKVDLLIGGDPISSERRGELADEIAGLAGYLEARGLPLAARNPTIRIDATATLPYYLPGDEPELVIPPDADARTVELFFAYHVLDALQPGEGDETRRGVGRGLAEYLASGYADVPPAPAPFDGLRLADALAVNDFPAAAVVLAGAAWAAFDWSLRDALDPEDADRVLVRAWIGTRPGRRRFERAFATTLVAALRDTGGATVADPVAATLRERGVLD